MRNPFNAVSKMFKSDPDVDKRSIYTPLQQAIMANDAKRVFSLLKKGANPNLTSSRAFLPPLHLALTEGHFLIVQMLIASKADINLKDGYGQTPLHHAVQMGQEAFVLMLLKMNADPNKEDHIRRTPLHMVPDGHPHIIDYLLKYKADINAQDRHGNTPLHLLLDFQRLAERFIEQGADLNIKNYESISPYMMMLEDGRLTSYPELVKSMLQKNADLTSTNALGETILHLTAKLQITDIFEDISGTVQWDAKDGFGNNALHALIRTQNVRMIEHALTKAPELVNDANNFGLTPLNALLCNIQDSLDRDCIETVRALLKHGANPNDADNKGRGLLHHAVSFQKIELLEEILNAGANPDLRDADGKTALHYAIEQGNLLAMDVLLDRNANPDMADARGWTILDRLAEHGDRDSSIVQRLIVAGGQYQKQLPLHPDAMQRAKVLDKKPRTPKL